VCKQFFRGRVCRWIDLCVVCVWCTHTDLCVGVHTHVCVFTRPLLCMYTHVYVYTRFGGLRGKRDFAGGRWLGMHVRVCACVQIVGCT